MRILEKVSRSLGRLWEKSCHDFWQERLQMKYQLELRSVRLLLLGAVFSTVGLNKRI